jgi:hypothetical protein
MVVCFSSHSNKLSDLIKYYKAQPRPNYRLMDAAAWAESAQASAGGGGADYYDNSNNNGKRGRNENIEVVKNGGAIDARRARFA